MLITDAHIEFEITLDKRSTSVAPEMPPEVIDYFINEAIARFVKTRYAKNNIYKAGFEETQKRTEDLRTLVSTEVQTTIAVPYEDDNYVQVDIPGFTGLYWFYLRMSAYVTKENCGSKYQEVKLVQQDDLQRVLRDPFNKPVFDKPVAYFENGNILLVSDDSFTITQAKVTYLRAPAIVNVGTYGGTPAVVEFDLPDHTHKEIVQLAADIAIENIESQRINTIKQQLATVE